MRKHTLVIGTCIVLMSNSIVWASPLKGDQSPPSGSQNCDEVLEAAKDVIDKGKELLTIQGDKLIIQKEQIDQLVEETAELLEKQDSIFRSPYLWLVLGVATGVTGMVLIRR